MEELNKLYLLNIDDSQYETRITKKFIQRKRYKPIDTKKVTAFIPGTIRDIFVKEGQQVSLGQDILILEAMKMKNIVKAPEAGIVKRIYFRSEQRVAKNELLFEME